MTTIHLDQLTTILGGAARAPKNLAAWIIAHTPGAESGVRIAKNTAAWVIAHTPVPKGFKIE